MQTIESTASRADGGDAAAVTLDAASSPQCSLDLHHTLPEKVTRLAQSLGSDPEIVVLAAYATVLSRHRGEADTSVTVVDEDRTGTISVTIGEDSSARMLVAAVRASLGADPDEGEGHPAGAFLISRNEEWPAHLPEADIVVSPRLVSDRPRLEARCEPSTPGSAGAGRLLAHLGVVLAGMVAQPDTPVLQLDMLTEQETRLLEEWNATTADYPRDLLLHGMFEDQVRRTPGAIALEYEGRQLLYEEFDRRANRLAHHLRALGVGPDVLVGVAMDRSIDLLVALYGVLKAGGAFVPLDPEFPADRLRFMLEDIDTPVVLVSEQMRTRIESLVAESTLTPTLVTLDGDAEAFADHPSSPPFSRVEPEHLAYVIYTSGSTGRPKGVMISHRSICNQLVWMQEEYGLTEEDVVLLKTPFSFDVSMWELFWPLQVGARLVIAGPDGHKDGAYLVRTINETGVTTIQFVPSMLEQFLQAPGVDSCSGLRRVISIGEALTHDLQERFFASLDTELHNLYGPTEATVAVTYWDCRRSRGRGIVPIGRPMANTWLRILDQHMRPVPIGVAGDLYIGGVQVARGYLNRPELTAERFIEDPYTPGARLYKTGDLARWLEDGVVDFLGRADFQVKLRGHRIELGEIEAVLAEHRAVRHCAITVEGEDAVRKRLVAHVVPTSPDAADVAALRTHVARRLPSYMVPEAWVFLDEMPLTANGKLDRASLPPPSRQRPPLAQSLVSPRDKLEELLASIWSEVLQVDELGVHDRFFDLGGNSLQAAQVVNRLQSELDESIFVVTLFSAPSIAEYAALLRREYPDALARRLGEEVTADGGAEDRVDEQRLELLERLVPTVPLAPPHGDPNPPAVFILSPPRSGTTLLRVMLAGHPDLFAASELQLLGFEDLEQRRVSYSGRFAVWQEGMIRTLMEIHGCEAREARTMMEEREERGVAAKDLYRELQQWVAPRILVDKSPSYALDRNALRRAERDFAEARYVHLVRHPAAMVRSFEEYHMDQVLHLERQPFTPGALGELVWLASHRNILEFLAAVPVERHVRITYEDLVRAPRDELERVTEMLAIPFHPDLLDPYHRIEEKMVDGIYADSRPMGDTKLLERDSIDPAAAERWREEGTRPLAHATLELARRLGYEPSSVVADPDEDQRSRRREFLQRRRSVRGGSRR